MDEKDELDLNNLCFITRNENIKTRWNVKSFKWDNNC